MTAFLDLLYLFAAVIVSPVAVYKMIWQKRYRRGWGQKFGKISRKDPSKKCIWIHAVSVGEVNATRTLIKQLAEKFGDFEIIITATTDTGFDRANALFGTEHTVFYFPLDFSAVMKRAFKNIRPDICLLMELEVWPNFTNTANQNNVPVVVVNGRISDKGFLRYMLIKSFAGKMFGKITLILAQTEQYARRFRQIGAEPDNVIAAGSLKYDTAQICDKVEGTDALAAELGIADKQLWVAGATGNDEEAIVLDVYRSLLQQNRLSNFRLVIVPRKPERFNQVAQIIKQKGFGCVRYGEVKKSTSIPVTDNQTVILGDTMGDLTKFYSLAAVIFVGRSLVPMGGSDMAEAAALGKCTIFGPHAFNFRQTVDALVEGEGAVMVENKEQLLETMQKCLNEPNFAEKIAENGRKVIKQNQGATKKTIEQIERLLKTV